MRKLLLFILLIVVGCNDPYISRSEQITYFEDGTEKSKLIKLGDVEILFDWNKDGFERINLLDFSINQNKKETNIPKLFADRHTFDFGRISKPYLYIVNNPFENWKCCEGRPGGCVDSSLDSLIYIKISYDNKFPKLSDIKLFPYFSEKHSTIGILFGWRGASGRGSGHLLLIDTVGDKYEQIDLEWGCLPQPLENKYNY